MMYSTTLIWPPTSPTQGLKSVRAIRRTDRRARQGLRRVSPSYLGVQTPRSERTRNAQTSASRPLGGRAPPRPNMQLDGIHHITCITADAPGNVDSYPRGLGSRLVKTTVNFDAPEAYHLYYGDERGAPG